MDYNKQLMNENRCSVLQGEIREGMKDIVLLDKFTDMHGNTKSLQDYNIYLMDQVENNVSRLHELIKEMEGFYE